MASFKYAYLGNTFFEKLSQSFPPLEEREGGFNPLKYNDPSGEFWGLFGVWFGNYAINWLDNTINKGMSAKQAFRQTPVMLSGSYSPSTNTLFNQQFDFYKAARHEEVVSQQLDQFIAEQRGKGREKSYEEYSRSINAFLLSSGVALNDLEKAGFWVGRTSKGEYNLYNYNKFKGNQYTTNSKLFQKLGIVGFFVGESVDFSNLMNGSITKNQFKTNTILGVSTLIAPEIGAGLLLWEGTQLYFELNRMFWEGSGGQWIYKGMYEMSNPVNYDPDYDSTPFNY